MMDNESYCPECGSGDSEGQLGHSTGCSLKDKWPKPQRMYVGGGMYEPPALTDEQVREIAEKWARKHEQATGIGDSYFFEKAIREAIGRGNA